MQAVGLSPTLLGMFAQSFDRNDVMPFGLRRDGALAAPNDQVVGPIARTLCAALHRSTLGVLDTQPGGGPADFYRGTLTNHYSRIVHQHMVDGKAYGFAFDDVLAQESLVHDGVGRWEWRNTRRRPCRELALLFRGDGEEMLVIQAAWTHARLARLSSIAHSQENRENLQAVHEACDRAANTFRRQMLALAEYRRPAQANSFVAIRQANVASQQVVQNVEPQAPSPQDRRTSYGAPASSSANRSSATQSVSSQSRVVSVGAL